jgi:hypothetical protein
MLISTIFADKLCFDISDLIIAGAKLGRTGVILGTDKITANTFSIFISLNYN